jgi:hypothetical protein
MPCTYAIDESDNEEMKLTTLPVRHTIRDNWDLL